MINWHPCNGNNEVKYKCLNSFIFHLYFHRFSPTPDEYKLCIYIEVHVYFRHFLPAFYSLYRYQGRILKEEIKPHPVLSRLFRSAAEDYLTFETTTVPMLSPPLPWTSIKSGGYLIAKVNMVR